MRKGKNGYLECEGRALLMGVCMFGASYCVLYFAQLYAIKHVPPSYRIFFPTVGAAALAYVETNRRLKLC